MNPLFATLSRWGALFSAVALVAGCASGPSRTPMPSGPGLPPVLQTERDGPPKDAPPNLALLPDPEPRIEPIRVGGPNKPYAVLGQSYEPMASDVAWKERGLASWYGTKFHGRRTASGEVYSVYGLTAAHRTLPIPSYARVKNLDNGKEMVVRINDRGPFHSNRVIDLSYAAAVKLGIKTFANVEIERLTFDAIRAGGASPVSEVSGVPASTPLVLDAQPSPPSRAYTPAAKGFWVQLAALSQRDGVLRLQRQVAEELTDLSPLLAVFHESGLYKLKMGPYLTRAEATRAAHQVKSALSLSPMLVESR